MTSQWNQVTWYSKLGALIVFLLVIPILSFYVGTQYERTQQTLKNQSIAAGVVDQGKISDSDIDNALLMLSMKKKESPKRLSYGKYQIFDGHGEIDIVLTAKGDLNNDGFEDAIVQELWCAASCGKTFVAILNVGGKTKAFDVTPPDITLAGYKQFSINEIDIQDGVVGILANNGTKDMLYQYTLKEGKTGEYILEPKFK
ncbi:MAG: hypothetical protein V4576_04005 [Patescibacteria group bacterium]